MSHQRPAIWAFASGKGGVGRSLIAANLAVALARRGSRAILVDADLGGANLHTLLGGVEAEHTLWDFFDGEVSDLGAVAASTAVPNLKLVSSARPRLGGGSLPAEHKRELVAQIASLAGDVVLLDLSAGSGLDTLDLFLAAAQGVLVVVPEPTSVENAYHFLKAAFHRRLAAGAERAGLGEALKTAMRGKASRGLQSPRELLAGAGESDPETGRELRRQLEGFRPRLIVNQARQSAESELGKEMVLACRDYLGVEARFLGTVPFDDHVHRSLHERKPAMELFPTSPFSSAIGKIAARLLEPDRPAAADLYSDDFRILGLQPGCRLTDVIAAHKRLKELYSQPSLATYSEADDERRAAMLERIEAASRRILREVSGAIPLAGT